MIGKMTLGRSFKFCGAYMLTGRDRVHPDQRVSWMECHHLPTERMEVAVRLMAATSRRSRRTQLPVLQLSVSFAPGDRNVVGVLTVACRRSGFATVTWASEGRQLLDSSSSITSNAPSAHASIV